MGTLIMVTPTRRPKRLPITKLQSGFRRVMVTQSRPINYTQSRIILIVMTLTACLLQPTAASSWHPAGCHGCSYSGRTINPRRNGFCDDCRLGMVMYHLNIDNNNNACEKCANDIPNKGPGINPQYYPDEFCSCKLGQAMAFLTTIPKVEWRPYLTEQKILKKGQNFPIR